MNSLTNTWPRLDPGVAYSAKIPAGPCGVKSFDANPPWLANRASASCTIGKRQLTDDDSHTSAYLDHMVILQVDEKTSYVTAHNLCYNVPALKGCKCALRHQGKGLTNITALRFGNFLRITNAMVTPGLKCPPDVGAQSFPRVKVVYVVETM